MLNTGCSVVHKKYEKMLTSWRRTLPQKNLPGVRNKRQSSDGLAAQKRLHLGRIFAVLDENLFIFSQGQNNSSRVSEGPDFEELKHGDTLLNQTFEPKL